MKKTLILIFISLIGLQVNAQVAQYDVNSNSRVNIGDVNALIANIATKNATTDVDRNDTTDLNDVKAITHYIFYNVQGYDFVDLGLPSGTCWATCNVGATKPEEYGDYLAWGETTPKDNYEITNYTSPTGDLTSANDAAAVNWTGGWSTPTHAQIVELRSSANCTWKVVTINNVKGYLVTSKKTNQHIFLPFGGYKNGSTVYQTGSTGYYWTTTINDTSEYSAYCMVIDNSNFTHCNITYWGRNVRPVITK